jgi:hypothetical protein
LGSVYLGWAWPKTHDERTAERRVRNEAARLAYYNWRDAIWEILDELESHRRDLGIQLVNGRTFGIFHAHDKWNKNPSVLNDEEFSEARELVRDAYLRTHALNQRTQERFDAASHDEVNDANWVKLSGEVNHCRARRQGLSRAHTGLIADDAGTLER